MVFATSFNIAVFFYCCATAEILRKLLQQCLMFFIVVVIPGQYSGEPFNIGPFVLLWFLLDTEMINF